MRDVPRTRLIGTATVAVVLSALFLALPSHAFALAASVPASPSVVVTATPLGTWALDFTLPTFGKSGCLVCHNDPNLVVPSSGGDVSFWIDEKAYDASAHGRVICTGCHLDFGYKAPHAKGAWRPLAKQSCSNCHGAQNQDYLAGLHTARPGLDKSPDPKAASKPLCGDCHGGHDIAKLKDDPAGRIALRATSEDMCGREGCHKDYWDNYGDYYHGAAYKAGAFDAPTCWDCHGTHTALATKDPLSPTNERNIAATCGKGANGTLDGTNGLPSCHEGSSVSMLQYAQLIHKKREVQAANPLLKLLATVRSWFSR